MKYNLHAVQCPRSARILWNLEEDTNAETDSNKSISNAQYGPLDLTAFTISPREVHIY
jgi:hypothetical protein